jgi:Type IV pilin-like G and H, putative
MLQKLLSQSLTLTLILSTSQLSLPTTLAQNTTPSPTPVNPSTKPELPELLGQWEVKQFSGLGINNMSLILTPEGKLYFMAPYSPYLLSRGGNFNSIEVFEIPYKINSSTKPMQVDILLGSEKENIKTIFEMTSDGKIRVELLGLNPGEIRPTEFTTGSILMEKISNFTKLPRNAKITSIVKQKAESRQSEGLQYVFTMARAQQAYFLENEKFSGSIKDLGLGNSSETENYSFRTITQGNQKQQVMMTATAKKPEIKSYIGVVYVVKDKKNIVTQSAICETEKPSTTPPAKPQITTTSTSKVQCPSGSRLVK